MTSAASGSSTEEVRHAYDVGNDFFRLWLDPRMTYSSALWEPGDTLERAQERKLDFHAEGARLRGARRVLDVGCGWGGFVTHVVERFGVQRAVGLTLSAAQAEWIRAHADPRVEVRVEHWADHRADEPYDAVVSVGAFEHFASFGQRSREKIAVYRSYFQRCHELTREGAWMTLQTIGKGDTRLDREAAHEMVWLYEEMYPGCEVPRLAEIAEAAERLFEIVLVRNDRDDYRATLDAWRDRLRAVRPEAERVAGAAMTQKYDRYLELSSKQFARGMTTLLRIHLRRV